MMTRDFSRSSGYHLHCVEKKIVLCDTIILLSGNSATFKLRAVRKLPAFLFILIISLNYCISRIIFAKYLNEKVTSRQVNHVWPSPVSVLWRGAAAGHRQHAGEGGGGGRGWGGCQTGGKPGWEDGGSIWWSWYWWWRGWQWWEHSVSTTSHSWYVS